MSSDEMKLRFNAPEAVEQAVRAAVDKGLSAAEEAMLTRVFRHDQTLLEIGCEAGRGAFGLWELGYRHVIGVDVARAMVTAARQLAAKLEYAVPFRVAEARRLPFGDGTFGGVIVLGESGRAQLAPPQRVETLRELARVVERGGALVMWSDAVEGAGDLAAAGWRREPHDGAPEAGGLQVLRRE